MSEEFFRVARLEIQTELDGLKKIFKNCSNDDQIYDKCEEIERHMHKIKGLAPMMDQKQVGDIAKTSDAILKHIVKNGKLAGSHEIISLAVKTMEQVFNGTESNTNDFRRKLKVTLPQFCNL